MNPPLDLTRHRQFGDLLNTAFAIFRSHLAVFLSVTLIVVTPVVLIIDGVWGRGLADGFDAQAPAEVTLTSNLLNVFIVAPLVTALHVVIVQALARGEEPTVGQALRAASASALPAVAVVALYGLGVGLGLILLIVPGIWLSIRWFFAAQAAVVDGLRGPAALRRSAELVKGSWWRTFGLLLGSGLVFVLVALALLIPLAIIAGITDSGVVYIVMQVLVQGVILSLGALFGTLLFFDLRARKDLPWQGSAVVDPAAPERPQIP